MTATFRAENQIEAKIVPQLSAGALEVVADVAFETVDKRLLGDRTEWACLMFTEGGMEAAIDAFAVFLQRVRDAKVDPDWHPEVDPRLLGT